MWSATPWRVHFSDVIENLIMSGFFALRLISFDRLGTPRCQELDGSLCHS
jgi:hypothetical protein